MGKTLTVAELAALLDVSHVAVIRRISRGTLDAVKVGNRWQIPQSEADRVLESQPNAGSHNVMDASPNVNLTVIEGADPAWQQDIDALQVENQALHRKLEVSEIQQESLSKEVETVRETLGAVRQEGERTRGDYEHTRDQLDSALRSVGSLTEEIKGLTVALHREQERHALAAAPVEEPFKEPKPGLIKRLFTRNKRPRHVRIGHA
jgi:excisionase family DNA binding protein